jgi:hypothetical protein
MKDKSEIENLEKLMGQLQGLHAEITSLAKKSPSDAVNGFKLKLINKVINFGNEVLGEQYRPFDDFERFNLEDVPSTSDVAMVLGQYIEEAERYRSDNVKMEGLNRWVYVLNGKATEIRTAPPSKIAAK